MVGMARGSPGLRPVCSCASSWANPERETSSSAFLASCSASRLGVIDPGGSMALRDPLIEHLLRRSGVRRVAPADLEPMPPRVRHRSRSPDQLRVDLRRRRRPYRRAGYVAITARAGFAPTPTSPMPASAGCSGWSTPSARCRRRWRSSGTTTSPPPTARSRAI